MLFLFSTVHILTKKNSLTELLLQYCNIDANSSVELADALSITSTLQKLSLAHNPIKERGFTALADMLKVNKSLQILNLLGCVTGAVGIRNILEALQYNANLKQLLLLHMDEHLAVISSIDTDGAIKGRVKWCPLQYTKDCINLNYQQNINAEVLGKKNYTCYNIRAIIKYLFSEATYCFVTQAEYKPLKNLHVANLVSGSLLTHVNRIDKVLASLSALSQSFCQVCARRRLLNSQ